jgi:hypothetical protein
MMTGMMTVGPVILTRSFQRPAGMLRRVAKARSETLRNKNLAKDRQGKGARASNQESGPEPRVDSIETGLWTKA